MCSVVTVGLAPDAARERALTTAHLALAAVALLWTTPSRALEGMNLLFDRRIHHQKALTFVPGKTVLAGTNMSHMPHGPWLEDGEWETLFAQNSPYFGGVAEIPDYVVDPARSQSRPGMLNALAQALLWFHEGRRESVTLMANGDRDIFRDARCARLRWQIGRHQTTDHCEARAARNHAHSPRWPHDECRG